MSSNLTFLNTSWFWPVLIGWVVLLLVFLWKEWSQAGKKRFLLKISLSVLAVSSLALIALKPAINEEVREGNVLIITEDFKQDQLDSLKKAYRKIKVIDYRKDEILPELKTSKQIFVLGRGISVFDLYQFEDLPVTYLAGDTLAGIVKLNYNHKNRVGNNLQVQGRFLKPKFGNRLVLEDAGGTAMDSIVFTSEENKNFKLETELKVDGNYIFNLTEKDSLGEILGRDALPVIVNKEEVLRILILNSYPTFELKYLKNFLAESGHELLVKNRITTGRFKFEFFNTENTNLGRLDEETLEDFDLLISDTGALRNLSSSETSALQNSIWETGLGLFLLGEANTLNSVGDFSVFELERVSGTETEIDNLPEVSIAKQPFQLKKEFGLEEIHNSNSSILSGYKRIGQGRIGTTLLENTWQLQLEGRQEAYQKIWSQLLEQISKRTSVTASWKAKNDFAFKDQAFELQLRTSVENPRVRDENDYLIPLKQDLNNSELWTGKTYPQKTGWQKLKIEQDSTSVFNYFVHNAEDWQALQSNRTSEENNRFFQQEIVEEKSVKMPIAINSLWFYGIFLISMGGLWLEPKL
ncbi:hypothetical protein [Salegentibacter mishustinae]|uniref:Aerotolerance regulator N-terminal domain-containing protein n=1 Tax=Salegentibacter mishustinae TaxID=270918 RepID=A0A0Q9Z7R5_9FLAO|nr:hypothetical protein [Salegentibacter mishustinae]KRG28989.1 hypothetical protein APR42_03415 [Salegentibacter mishustinae]PNW21959.1 hypothetical protein APB85_12080 [Salegentibacter mishustinae]PZX65314.1 hypothetical protein LY54_01607 [Salegentibacter mishustinae]GGW85896.1 hypothetical protein GCM10008086_12690 [Salegentibacter mishustinae]